MAHDVVHVARALREPAGAAWTGTRRTVTGSTIEAVATLRRVQGRRTARALPRLRGADGAGAAGRPDPEARRRDARRQPALGARPSATTPPTATAPAPPTSSRCSTGARRSASRSSRCGCSRPTTSTAAPTSSTRCSRSSRRRSPRLAEQRRWRLHPVGALDLLPAAHRRAAQAGGRRHPRRRRAAGQHRGRLRRPARDRRRRPLPARPSTPPRAPASRSSPRSSTSSTSPTTSTPRASPTPTW